MTVIMRVLPFHQGFSVCPLQTSRTPVVGGVLRIAGIQQHPQFLPSLGASSIVFLRTIHLPTPKLWLQKCLQTCQMSPTGRNCPLLRTSAAAQAQLCKVTYLFYSTPQPQIQDLKLDCIKLQPISFDTNLLGLTHFQVCEQVLHNEECSSDLLNIESGPAE